MSRTAIALHICGWTLFIPLWIYGASWLKNSTDVQVDGLVFVAFWVFMVGWALWIFGDQFSYTPLTARKILGFACYILLMGSLGTIGFLASALAVALQFGL